VKPGGSVPWHDCRVWPGVTEALGSTSPLLTFSVASNLMQFFEMLRRATMRHVLVIS